MPPIGRVAEILPRGRAVAREEAADEIGWPIAHKRDPLWNFEDRRRDCIPQNPWIGIATTPSYHRNQDMVMDQCSGPGLGSQIRNLGVQGVQRCSSCGAELVQGLSKQRVPCTMAPLRAVWRNRCQCRCSARLRGRTHSHGDRCGPHPTAQPQASGPSAVPPWPVPRPVAREPCEQLLAAVDVSTPQHPAAARQSARACPVACMMVSMVYHLLNKQYHPILSMAYAGARSTP